MSVSAERVDPWGMAFVHRIYRSQLNVLPALIEGVADGDRDRAAVVGEHLNDVTRALNHHHVGEDELVWPLLLDRVGLHADTVHRMEQQHEKLHGLLERIAELLPRWTASAAAADRADLVKTVSETSAVTNEHLEDEEQHVVPLIEEHLTVGEWAAFEARGEEFLQGEPPHKAFLWLGLGFENATEYEKAKFLAGMPEEVQQVWAGPGKQEYAAAIARLHDQS